MTWYVVYKGRVPGVYDDWEACQSQVHYFCGNSYKGFHTRTEAEARFAHYLAGERRHYLERERRRNRMPTIFVVMMLIVLSFLFYVFLV